MATYASPADVRTALGKIGQRLPVEIDVDAWLAMAHAELVDRLALIYPGGIPTFADDGLEVVRWAEAKLAAAEILDLLRAQYPAATIGGTPAALRAAAGASVSGGVVGYPPGARTDDPNAPGVAVSARPRVGSSTQASAFPDPYDDVRGDPGLPWL